LPFLLLFSSGTKNQSSLYNILVRELSSILIFLGRTLIALSLISLFLIFYPVLKLELQYWILGPSKGSVVSLDEIKGKKVIKPLDESFGIVIPKIRANSKIVAEVNPYKEREYQLALTRGVAHAKSTGYPGQGKNIFLFSHSSVDFYNAARYNSIFYLLEKLENNDEIYIFYKGEKYKYKVSEKKIVAADAVSYINLKSNIEQLTLMTCWPPGTTYKRLLVIATLSKN